MWSFVLGLIVGLAAKAVYDLFKEEQLPSPMGLNAGRLEALLDETRQTVRDLREEVRQAVAGEGSIQEKATRVLSAAGESVVGAREQSQRAGTDPGGRNSQDHLKLTSGAEEGEAATTAPGEGAPAAAQPGGAEGTQGDGGTPTATHGTIQTMS